jgi:ABC-2 type transport system ATP-binding protein
MFKQKLLIVDADENIAELISLYLEKEQYDTETAHDGEEALKLIEVYNPDLLLLDEAYDGLEPLARMQVKKLLAERIEEKGMSVIISSHSLRELEEICDSFGILENGTLLDYGDLLEKKGMVNKYQIAFEAVKTKEDFRDLDVLSFSASGRIVTLLARGDKEEVTGKIHAMKPVLLDVLPVSFEELFMSEIEEGRQK